MTHLRLAAGLAVIFAALLPPAIKAQDVEPTTASRQAARCQVWARELGFARAVAEHDAAAFAGYVHPQAAFGVGRKPTLGREAIVREWQGIIDGSAVALEWYPDTVTVGGDGSVVYSSGPALFKDPGSGKYSRSRYGSVWQRGQDGVWQVVFDDGSAPQPADAAAVLAFREGRATACSAD